VAAHRQSTRVPIFICRLCFGRSEDRKNQRVVTCSVKAKLSLAAFELDRKDGRARNENGIDTTAKSRHVEFQIKRTLQPLQDGTKNLDLLLPRLSLSEFEIVRVAAG
jgi:hypothetical protein